MCHELASDGPGNQRPPMPGFGTIGRDLAWATAWARRAEFRMEAVLRVAVEVKGEVERGDQVRLQFPRTRVDEPGHQGVRRHPLR